MEARGDIVLSVGLILIELSTGRFWKITYKSAPKARRNSGGYTKKKSSLYHIESLDGKAKWSYIDRGILLIKFRLPETPVEKVLYGQKT